MLVSAVLKDSIGQSFCLSSVHIPLMVAIVVLFSLVKTFYSSIDYRVPVFQALTETHNMWAMQCIQICKGCCERVQLVRRNEIRVLWIARMINGASHLQQ